MTAQSHQGTQAHTSSVTQSFTLDRAARLCNTFSYNKPVWSALSSNVHETGPQGRRQCSLVSSSSRFPDLKPPPTPIHTLWPDIFSHQDDVNESCVSKWRRESESESALVSWSEPAPAHNWICALQSKTRSSHSMWDGQEKYHAELEIHQYANYIKDFKRFSRHRKWR